MAFLLRRTLSSHRSNLSLLIRTTSFHSHRHLLDFLVSSPNHRYSAATTSCSFPNSLAINFFSQSHRGFAKARKQNIDDDEDDDERSMAASVNIGPSVKAATVSQMEAAVEALFRELNKLRTGRASTGMLDHIIVETSGMKMPLSRIAVISVLDSKTLSVTPYDPNTLKELEKAIVSSPLGVNPKTDNQRLIAAIPPLTKEHMQAVCKVVAKSSEDVKQSIRRARQKALDTIKKALPKKKEKEKSGSSLTEDGAKRLEKEIDELTKKFIKSAEDMCKAKEKEITQG